MDDLTISVDKFAQNIELSHAHLLVVNNADELLLRVINTKLKEMFFLPQNIIEVLPLTKQIVKDQIKEIKEKFKYETGHEKTAYIICKAEDMNPHAYNSLLKFLEEPINNVIAILITENMTAVPDTIKSRCQVFHLNDEDNSINDYFEEIIALGVDNSYLLFKEKVLELSGDEAIIIKLIKYAMRSSLTKNIRQLNSLLTESYLNLNKNLLIDELFYILAKRGDQIEKL